MNAIFLTQSGSLDLFFHLMKAMDNIDPLEKVGFYVADSRFFNRFKVQFPEIESGQYSLLKEWEIIRVSESIRADRTKLDKYEKKLGDPLLWNAIVADRRIYYGKKYAYTQDYKSRFDFQRMLSILQVGLERMEKLFDDVQPDFIVSFQCVTIGEYLSYLMAKHRNIPVLNLRPTRIRNLFYAGESVLEPSESLRNSYQGFLIRDLGDSLERETAEYINEVRQSHSMYEGVLPVSLIPRDLAKRGKKGFKLNRIKRLFKLLQEEYSLRYGQDKYDTHLSGFIGPNVRVRIIQPYRTKRMNRQFSNIYVKAEDLSSLDYAFFPLHTEPEIVLSVYCKPFLNQIEAIRLFSHNLPVGMKLVVKEHPWAIGKRPLSYYRKILDIPNVLLAYPGLKSRELITHARLVSIIAGSIGFEALILKKPVVMLGHAPFEFLPQEMIRCAKNPDRLGNDVREILENYNHDERALQAYIAAVMSNSVPVDFYSVLLSRKGVYRPEKNPNNTGDSNKKRERTERQEQIQKLASYLLFRYKAFTKKE